MPFRLNHRSRGCLSNLERKAGDGHVFQTGGKLSTCWHGVRTESVVRVYM